MDEKFEEYTQILDAIKQTEAEGQSKAEEAIEVLRLFIRDNRICAPDAVIDLEDNEQNINESFSSSNINNSCEEQINIETSNIKNFDDENEENNKKLEKEWYEIKDLLLNKEV